MSPRCFHGHRTGLYIAFAILALPACASSARMSSREEPYRPSRRTVPLTATLVEREDLPLTDATETVVAAVEASTKSAEIAKAEVQGTTPDDAPKPRLPRLTSVGLFTHIHAGPSRATFPLGYVHVGSSVALRSPDPLRLGQGCATAWYAIEPRGYVCNDNTTILETEARQLSPTAERLLKGYVSMIPRRGPLPYGYALSLGTPMYGRIPEPEEQRQNEGMFGQPPVALGPWAKGHDGLASADRVQAERVLPWFLANGGYSPVTVRGRDSQLVRKLAPRGSMFSFRSAFEAEGRTWLLTPELSVVPADRVRIYRETSFHGIELGSDLRLPIAWIRKRPRPKWRAEGGRFAPTDEAWAMRTAVGLTGKRVAEGNRVLLETTDAGAYLDAADATVVEQGAERPRSVDSDDKWIRISVTGGTLTAYEGDEPVFATLISPGVGGLSRSKYPTVHALATRHVTPLGVHRIQFKDRFSVMSPDPEQKKFFISDVPYIQYFYGPFALHASFWHEDFGEPKSGGCVNLAPADAERLFAWTEPALPPGWHAVRPGGPNGRGTVVQIVP